MSPRRRWAAAGAVPLALAGWLGLRAALPAGPAAGWVEVERADLVVGVDVVGTLQPIDPVRLGPPEVPDVWDFKIARLAAEGSAARRGDPVLVFDTSELARKLEERAAEHEQAEREIEKLHADLGRTRADDELRLAEAEARERKARLQLERPPDLVAANELRKVEIDLDLAQKEVAFVGRRRELARRSGEAQLATLAERRDRAAARLAEIGELIERMTVRAPRAGTVVYVTGWRDEKKKVGDSCWKGEKVLELPDLDRMRGEGTIDESDAARIADGQPVTLALESDPDLELRGRIEAIHRSVQRRAPSDPLKVIRVDLALDRVDPRRMRPGMRFRGKVEVERVKAALLVPLAAVDLSSGRPAVVRRGALGGEEVVYPRLGRRDGERVEVLDGLAAGDRVLLREAAAAGGGRAR